MQPHTGRPSRSCSWQNEFLKHADARIYWKQKCGFGIPKSAFVTITTICSNFQLCWQNIFELTHKVFVLNGKQFLTQTLVPNSKILADLIFCRCATTTWIHTVYLGQLKTWLSQVCHVFFPKLPSWYTLQVALKVTFQHMFGFQWHVKGSNGLEWLIGTLDRIQQNWQVH